MGRRTSRCWCEEAPADAVPSTTGCVLLTLRSHRPSRCPAYSRTSWHVALDVVALKLDTICSGGETTRQPERGGFLMVPDGGGGQQSQGAAGQGSVEQNQALDQWVKAGFSSTGVKHQQVYHQITGG